MVFDNDRAFFLIVATNSSYPLHDHCVASCMQRWDRRGVLYVILLCSIHGYHQPPN